MHKVLDYIASPGIVIPLLMLLVLIIYYLISLTNALREANNDLKVIIKLKWLLVIYYNFSAVGTIIFLFYYRIMHLLTERKNLTGQKVCFIEQAE